MEHALQLPKLNLSGAFPSAAITPKFLDFLDPPTFPFTAPSWCLPQKPRSIAILDVFKNHEVVTTYTVDQKAIYLIGRYAVMCDIVLDHCSVSRLHAGIIHHTNGAAYLVDLGSCHGTFIDDIQLRARQPTLLTHGAVLKFGASSRSYAFKTFESQDQILERIQLRIELQPDEMEVEQNTLMNRALSYRLGFSIPHTHKAVAPDAQGDDPMAMAMALFPSRQMEVSTSGAGSARRTQSEDNTITSFPLNPIPCASHHQTTATVTATATGANTGAAEPHGGSELGRKRSRTQSAQALVANGAMGMGFQQQQQQQRVLPDGTFPTTNDNDEDAISKRVHFSEQPVETIPPRAVYFTPEHTPSSAPSSASPPSLVAIADLPLLDGKALERGDDTMTTTRRPLSVCVNGVAGGQPEQQHQQQRDEVPREKAS